MDAHSEKSKSNTVLIELRPSAGIPLDWTHLTAELKPRTDVSPIPADERAKIEKLFWIVSISLLGMISTALAGSISLLSGVHVRLPAESFDWQLPLLGMVEGFLGSSTAALRSALDRHANGIEDRDGNQWPDPHARKERFNRGMAIWFLYRPVLGTVMGFLIYLMADAGLFGVGISQTRLAFFALVAGLFAKSLLDLLLDKFKQIFG
jgi:hypothetical protein